MKGVQKKMVSKNMRKPLVLLLDAPPQNILFTLELHLVLEVR